MITQEIIIKTIDDAITKCGEGWNLSNRVRTVFKNFAEKHSNLDHEELIMVKGNGEIVFTKTGTQHQVKLTDEEDEALWSNYSDLYIDHNHPTVLASNVPTCLSWEDMKSLTKYMLGDEIAPHEYEEVYLTKSITAESPNGSRMTLVRNNKFNIYDNGDDYEKSMKLLQTNYSKYTSEFKETMWNYATEKAIEYKNNHPTEKVTESMFREEAEKYAYNKIGSFEDSREFKSSQQAFRNANCNLEVEWLK